ncbi:ABC transporter substrate-binding protein [Shewanella sp. VB17]|uniref:substrate-binding periplasmic protein n=1 Tax=Shewanella sp. VB17 TaxID=2739432 RepID=UPI0015661CE0|nr:ABC transporter substrate-binding protein [Shewanella sp. VB17]NRD74749.1 ABC transporter substrate-binding protein [Shewanella sp. VB17]
MRITLLIKTLFLAGVGVLATPLTTAAELDQLNFITESYPPYNFESNGEIKGIAVDLLLAAAKQSSSSLSAKKISLLPWPKAYKMARMGPEIVLFSITRTDEREDKFSWVGPIMPTRIILLAKKSDSIVINSPDDMNKYTIGAIPNDIGELLVKESGVKSSDITHIATAESLAKMLATDGIKLWAYEENVARWIIKQAGLDNNDFESVYTLKDSELYYAFSKDVDKSIQEVLQKSIDDVKASGLFDKIKADYL